MHIDGLNALRMLSCPDLHRPYSEILKSSPPEVMKIKIDVIAELKIHSSVGFLFYGVLGQVFFICAHLACQLQRSSGHSLHQSVFGTSFVGLVLY